MLDKLSLYRDYVHEHNLNCFRIPIVTGTKEMVMPDFNEISKALGGMPLEGLVASVILAAFGLAAYAIYAVLTVVKRRR